MILFVDPSHGPAPFALSLAFATRTQNMPFHLLPADTHRCGRCNRDLRQHWWQVVDEATDEQGGVIDCALVPANLNGASS
uniref:hypothetical protein n=1 Tax=Paractinoplanes polyasparticus TaxID=2856853 RepID=UPI001C845E02|nr:hypothetical protein [Actinoplanes polyasparticus]